MQRQETKQSNPQQQQGIFPDSSVEHSDNQKEKAPEVQISQEAEKINLHAQKKQSLCEKDFFNVSRGQHHQKHKDADPEPFNPSRISKVSKSSIMLEEALKSRIFSENVICNDEDTKSIIQSVTCPICLLVLQPPYYECEGCSNNYCIECLQSWWKKCPNSCVFKCSNTSFKQVKRSNTYNAVVGMLKLKCQYCQQDITINDYATHMAKTCKQAPQQCRFCDREMKRKSTQHHEQNQCLLRPWKCEDCQVEYCFGDKDKHGATCKQKQFPCQYEGCTLKIKRRDLNEHNNNCPFKPCKCKWCSKQMKQQQIVSHEMCCELRVVFCKFCRAEQYTNDIYEHELTCSLRAYECKLCNKMILHYDVDRHKMDCVFDQIMELRQKNERIEMENVRLKERVILLEGVIQQTISNSKSSTIKVVTQIRDQQKKLVQKDLLRLDNSIRSVQKLRKQEVSAHMKFPHLIQSWCPICRELQKKFKAMLDPLFEQRKQVLHKISQIERFSYTPGQ